MAVNPLSDRFASAGTSTPAESLYRLAALSAQPDTPSARTTNGTLLAGRPGLANFPLNTQPLLTVHVYVPDKGALVISCESFGKAQFTADIRNALGAALSRAKFSKATTLQDVYKAGATAARDNGGPLGYLEISSHGSPGEVDFSDGKGGYKPVAVFDFVKGLVDRGIIEKGSVLHLGGCDIAGNKFYNMEISQIAKSYGITIIASRSVQSVALPGFDLFLFKPNGKIDYQAVKTNR